MSKSRKVHKCPYLHRESILSKNLLQNTISEIIVSFTERADTSGNGAAQKVDKRKNEPHPRNALFFAKLALVEGELLLTVSEEYFNIPAFCVDIENFQ